MLSRRQLEAIANSRMYPYSVNLHFVDKYHDNARVAILKTVDRGKCIVRMIYANRNTGTRTFAVMCLTEEYQIEAAESLSEAFRHVSIPNPRKGRVKTYRRGGNNGDYSSPLRRNSKEIEQLKR